MGLKTELERWRKSAGNEVAGVTLAWAALAMGTATAVAAAYIGNRSYRLPGSAAQEIGTAGSVGSVAAIWKMILTSFITALGRQISGVAQAREGRYQVAAMLFWCGIGLWLIIQFRRFGSFRPYALIVFRAVFLWVSMGEIRTVFNAFHHFAPAAGRAMLKSAVEARQPTASSEIPERALTTIIPLFFTPLFIWIATPFMRPFQWRRLLWTYLFPLVPLTSW